MMTRSQNMSWKDVNSITNFTENTPSNKSKKAKKSPSILLASIQLMENFIKEKINEIISNIVDQKLKENNSLSDAIQNNLEKCLMKRINH